MRDLNRIPLSSLRAVESVARNGSLRKAADDLGVTPGAISQQVLLAERSLGLALFDRRSSGMVPTEQGREVTGLLVEGFARIEAAVTRALHARDGLLTVSVAPVFAARWLIWRLPDFYRAHPNIRVRIDSSLDLVDPDTGAADVCIRVGRGGWPGVSAERLFDQIVFPVAAPALAERLRTPQDLAGVPVIRETRPGFSWADWLQPAGYPDVGLGSGPEFSRSDLCIDAAMTGVGVFLAFETLATDALTAGRLVAPFPGRFATKNSYWLVTAGGRPPNRVVRAFVAWLKAAIAEAGLGCEEGA